jgi:hypothetical protein
MPKPRVFDSARRTDKDAKMLTESTFAYLNRSGRPGSRASRALIEVWLSNVPAAEHEEFRSRFRCGIDVQFTSALQELTLHELLRSQGCKLRFHPNVPATTYRPDFNVRELALSAQGIDETVHRSPFSKPYMPDEYFTMHRLNGHWWKNANPVEKKIYLLAWLDAHAGEATIWLSDDIYESKGLDLNVPLRDLLKDITDRNEQRGRF